MFVLTFAVISHRMLFSALRAAGIVRVQGAVPLARGPSPSGGHSRPTSISPTRPASRDPFRVTAVKPRPTCKSPYAPARLWRAARGQGGTAPCQPRDLPSSGGLYRPTSISPTRPASRDPFRVTAVKPRPTCKSPYAPARLWRAARGQGGTAPCQPRDLPSSGGLYRPTSISPTRPASRDPFWVTAVKPRPTCKSLYAPARQSRAVTGAGL